MPASSRLAFSAPAASNSFDAFTWRAKFPEDKFEAAGSLIEGETRLANYVASLHATEVYIDRLARGQAPLAEVVNSTVKSEELRQLLSRTQMTRASLDFGLVDDASAAWSKVSVQFSEFLQRMRSLISHYASIETFIGDKLIAQTFVTWVGDSHTLWQTSRGDLETALHQRNVALSLKSKDAWIQTFVVVVQGTTKLSLLLASGSIILALPATWRLVQDMMAQAETLQKILSEKV